MHSLLKHTLDNLRRHWTLSLNAVIVIGLLFLLLNLLVFSSGLTKNLMETLRNRISFPVYLQSDTDFFTIRRIMETLEQRDDVMPPVTYISSEEAKNQLIVSLGLDQNFLKKYQLTFPASLTITPKTPADEKTIRKFLTESSFQGALAASGQTQTLQQGKTFETVTRNLERLRLLIRSLLALLVGFLVAAGILTVFITLRFVASLRRKELFIMKLVGASPAMLEIPYVLEGIAMALFGLFLGTGLFLLTPYFFFDDPFLLETYKHMALGKLFILEFFGSILIGAVASLLTVRKLMFSKKTLSFTV